MEQTLPRIGKSAAERLEGLSVLRSHPRRYRRWLVFASALVWIALISLLYVNQTSDLATTAYDVSDLQSQKARWEMRNQQLRLEIARLESLDRVDREARARLKMGPPARVIYVTAPDRTPPISTPTPDATPPATSPADAIREVLRRVFGLGGAEPTGP